jgi:IS1 family transposase
MGSLSKELRKIQMVVFDRFMRSSDNPDEARLLAEASKQIPKDRRVVIVDSDLAYGNARALAIDLNKVLDEDELLFLAYDQAGLNWAKSNGLPAAVFSSKSEANSAELWDKLIRAKVSVYDTHNWWRTRDQLLQRSLLEGSYKVQLWHGATGPVGKVFGLERLNTAKTFWHFSAVATSSVGFDVLVNEPSQAEYRRTRSMIAEKSVHDVEYRLVEAMNSKSWMPKEKVKILVAPTYSESTEGEDQLVAWIAQLAGVARTKNWIVDVALHPGAKPRVAKLIKKHAKLTPKIDGVTTNELLSYSAVVTDFSGIAHDALLLGIPTVSVLVDFDNYQDLCPSLVDQDQMDVAYVVNEIKDLQNQIELAISSDPLASEREAYVNKVVTGLQALPGVNTRESVLAALNA